MHVVQRVCQCPAEKWAVAAKEGLVIYMRGEPMALNLPPDLLERMMDYVIHVLVTLALLVESPGEDDLETTRHYVMYHGWMCYIFRRREGRFTCLQGASHASRRRLNIVSLYFL